LLLVLDSNEYIFSFGFLKKNPSEKLIDIVLDTFPLHSIRIPRLIVEEVRRHLTPEEYKEFIGFIMNVSGIDEDFVVPFELGARYEALGFKPADAFIAAYAEWTGAEAFVTENGHFLKNLTALPFAVITADECLRLINLPKG
jgi:hypothetical protein